MGVAGFAVVGVAFGMARYCYGLTLPEIRQDLGLTDLVLGVIASASFVGYLAGLLLSRPLAARRGPRAPTTLGGACAVVGCVVVALAPSAPVVAVGAVLSGSAAGWVWAPYLDIVERLAAERDRPRLLALISTGIGAGLVLLGAVALATAGGAWRLAWAGVAVAAALALTANLRFVPRLPAIATPADGLGARSLLGTAALSPLAFVTVAFAACTLYLLYAADAALSGGLDPSAVAVLYVVFGVAGLVALVASRLVAALGAGRLAAICLAGFGLSLAALGLLSSNLAAVIASAALFGATYMTGSAVVSIWVTQVFPGRSATAFTGLFVAGALASIVTPTAVGAALGVTDLSTVLVVSAVATVATAVVIGAVEARVAPPTAG